MSVEMEEKDPIITSSDEAPEAQEATAEDTGRVAEDPAAALAALAAERDKLAAENTDLHDRLLRRHAEFDNFRKRAKREREQYLEFSGAEMMTALLPILDDFERAMTVASNDAEYVRGIELIYKRLMEGVRKLGLEPLDAVGKQFDPNLHHAVDRVASDEAEEGTVLEELQRGYNYKGKLLRPAMVRVAYKG
ncbi:MAG: nucleotide exchange factor GrpE [Bryobacteraceae bacterium]